MELQFVAAQPASLYYAWQVEVMLTNFISMGINLNHVDLVCHKENGVIHPAWDNLANNYAARFFFYDDTRDSKIYVSSIRPNILKQHFAKYPELKNKAIFYHDCDIVFTQPFDFGKFLFDEHWYGSDTISYISHDYILSKGNDVLDLMCDIVNIDKEIIKENNDNSIGAQYLMKGIDADFWAAVEMDSEALYKRVNQLNFSKKELDNSYHELQIWCADMWAVLWNGWKRGYKTIIDKDFDFAWSTSAVKEWDKCKIYHNAGAVHAMEGMFYKHDFLDKLPYNQDLKVEDKFCCSKYYELIQQTAKTTVL
jgi:hypothetical protein